MTSSARVLDMVAERGSRYCVAGTIRIGEHTATYADTADEAEKILARYETAGYYQTRVYLPVGSTDLAQLGRDRRDAKTVLREKTALLRAAVVRAIEEGRAEAEIARTAGIDRMTVRAWKRQYIQTS